MRNDFGTGNRPYSVVIGLLNDDAILDLAVANVDSWTVSVLLGNGDGSFGTKSDYGTAASPVSIALGDVNRDGRPDLAVANYVPDAVSVLANIGAANPNGVVSPKSTVRAGLVHACPNPARGTVLFDFALPRAGHASLSVYDTAGRLVWAAPDQRMESGTHSVLEHTEQPGLSGFRGSRGSCSAPGRCRSGRRSIRAASRGRRTPVERRSPLTDRCSSRG